MKLCITKCLALILFLSVSLAAGCARRETISNSDRNLLLLNEQLPLGSMPADVRKAMASVEGQRSEGIGSLTEMKTSVSVLGTRATVEFNFKSDSLYGVYFHPEKLPSPRGDALFDSLVAFYSARFGQARVSDGADDPYFVKYRSWQGQGFEVGVTNAIEGDMRQLGWGYQAPSNLTIRRK